MLMHRAATVARNDRRGHQLRLALGHRDPELPRARRSTTSAFPVYVRASSGVNRAKLGLRGRPRLGRHHLLRGADVPRMSVLLLYSLPLSGGRGGRLAAGDRAGMVAAVLPPRRLRHGLGRNPQPPAGLRRRPGSRPGTSSPSSSSSGSSSSPSCSSTRPSSATSS